MRTRLSVTCRRLSSWSFTPSHLFCLEGAHSAELHTLELAAAPPLVDIFEVGQGAGRMADIELGGRTGLASLIVVVTGRAIGPADHPADAGQEQLDPAILGVPRDLDLLEAI